MTRHLAVLTALMLLSAAVLAAAPTSTPDPTYLQLRQLTAGETFTVGKLVLKRDAGTFTFNGGLFTFLAPVSGKITGAVYSGDGTFSLQPPLAEERASLKLLSKSDEFVERFNTVVLRFSDGTADEIKKAGQPGGSAGGAVSDFKDAQEDCRHKLHYNLDARVLADLLSGNGGLFVAFIKGKSYSGKMIYTVDPQGAPEVAPEEVSLRTYDLSKSGIWTAFHLQKEYATAARPAAEANVVDVETQKLDTAIERNGYLRGDAITTFKAARLPLRVAPFDLYPTLRVSKVTAADGQPLAFIQEDKKEDADLWVVLPKTLAPGEEFTIHTVYEGKDAVVTTGGDNFMPIARDDWYPATTFGDYATYDMTFHIPKKLKLVASAEMVSDKLEGDQDVSKWRSTTPQAVAGFNLGDFKIEQAKGGNQMAIEAYTNKSEPDFVSALKRVGTASPSLIGERSEEEPMALGSMDTRTMMKKPLAEAQLATALYTDYFGPVPYKRLSMTQQTACNFGQSWPELVFLPICSFFDATVQHELQLDDTRGYWQIVAPHEVAHQWWGQTVGFASYRDQWMSEGFAEFSASLFIQMIEKNPQKFIKFWNDERDLLTESNREGFRAIDVGPVTLGYRLANTRAGYDIPRRLIYPKGGYILHMIRMMMWDAKAGDQPFQAAMKDFVTTYANRPATTEEFKALLEKHMTPAMNVDHNGKLDWFFNEFVYGTALPKYSAEGTFRDGAAGTKILHLKVTQANVDASFKMLVPVYLALADNRVVRLGQMMLAGNMTHEQDIPLQIKDTPKGVLVNYYDDILAGKN